MTNNFSKDLLRKIFLSFIFPVTFLFLYPNINHGDYEFYNLIYYNHIFIFDNIFFANDQLTGFVCEFLFAIIFIIFSKIMSFNSFNFILDFILFFTLISLIRKYTNNYVTIFIFLLCGFYFFSIALSSVRSEIFTIFFVLSLINLNKTISFYTFFCLAFFSHSSLALLNYFFVFLLFYNEIQILKNLSFVKIILILFPLLISAPLNISKVVGYNDQNIKIDEPKEVEGNLEEKLLYLQGLLKIEQEKLIKYQKNSDKYEMAKQRVSLLNLEIDQLKNKVRIRDDNESKQLSYKNNLNQSINLSSLSKLKNKINSVVEINFKIINIELPKANILAFKDLLLPELSLTYKIQLYYIFLILYFHIFFYFFYKRDITVYLSLFFSMLIFGIIGISKATIVLFIMAFFIMIKNQKILTKNKNGFFIILIFLFPFLLKNIVMIYKIINYGRIF